MQTIMHFNQWINYRCLSTRVDHPMDCVLIQKIPVASPSIPQTVPGTSLQSATVCATANSGIFLSLVIQVRCKMGSFAGGTTWSNIVNTTNSLSYTNLNATTQYRVSVTEWCFVHSQYVHTSQPLLFCRPEHCQCRYGSNTLQYYFCYTSRDIPGSGYRHMDSSCG